MIKTDLWQEATLQELTTLLQHNQDVLTLATFGSSIDSQIQRDFWSDIDVLLVVSDGAMVRFYPAIEWLQPLGTLYAYEQSANAFSATTRVCFQDLRRIDILISTETQFTQIEKWPRVPFWKGVTILFSRSHQVEALLSSSFAPPAPSLVSAEAFVMMVHDFWFKALVAVYKIVRNDLLVALHLALDLVRDCCVLKMMLRDRAEGTNIHREGGIGNQFVRQLEENQQPYTALGILATVEQSTHAFDELATRWSDTYQKKHEPLQAWIGLARETVMTHNSIPD